MTPGRARAPKPPDGYEVVASGTIRKGDLLHFLRVNNPEPWEEADALKGETAEDLAADVIVARRSRPARGRGK